MNIVRAFACSHAALFVTRREQAGELERGRVYAAFAEMGRRIREVEPDAILIVGTDHGRIYPLTAVPQYLIGVSEQARGVGDAGMPEKTLALHQPYARAILDHALEEGVDLAYSEAMAIDHSFLTPLLLALPELDIPIVPIVQNCNVPPRPTLARAHAVGRALGHAVTAGPPGRVVVIGTGGLSHWVGSAGFQEFLREPAGTRLARQSQFPLQLPDAGPVNDSFDREFLESICAGRARDFIRDWSPRRLEEAAGNGAQEIRNWLLIAGLIGDRPGQVLDYTPVAAWLTGVAVVEFDAGVN